MTRPKDPYRNVDLEYAECRSLLGHKWDMCPPLPDVRTPAWGTTVWARCERCLGHKFTTWPGWGKPYRRYFPADGYDLGMEQIDRGELRESTLKRLAAAGAVEVGERPNREVEPKPKPRRRLTSVA